MEGLEKLKPIALLFLRLALGIIFIFHGYPKLFTIRTRQPRRSPRWDFLLTLPTFPEYWNSLAVFY
jgi:uncharacterized membrane protein YphA (DoxX/SURF4 family)